ncbi:hypothetical protein [Roseivirga echinicomitans]|uniref:hypothetical protein n=1 Tax=Roseivirga echinicomitans TaxID=296218 RepID=UPI000ADC417E|nr:hypothetical protein [Roseivirga echinicomitans]
MKSEIDFKRNPPKVDISTLEGLYPQAELSLRTFGGLVQMFRPAQFNLMSLY